MNSDAAYELIKICLSEGFFIVSPIILVALAVGITVSLLQTVTSIQEQTLAFVPKLIAAGITMWFIAPWMLERLGGLVSVFFQRAGEVLR